MAETKNIALFKWGKKRGFGGRNKNVQFYESFTYDGLDYTLYDNVYLHKAGQPLPYIGKLIKIWENPDQSKRVKVLWFFRPCEISSHLVGELAHPNEVFLASGEGVGLANVNPLEAISGKCNVVCISKDRRNPQPSDQDVEMADFVFYRTFDVSRCIIVDKMENIIAGIDVQFLFNQTCSLTHSSIRNADEDDKHTGETAMLITEENRDLKVDEKSKSIENLGELDERSRKKAKLDCSVKVSDEKNDNDGLVRNRDSDGNDSKDKSRCATNPNGASENSSTELKVDDELTQPSCKLTYESSSRHPNDGIETGNEASEVANRADFSSGRETIRLGRSYTRRGGVKDDRSEPKWTTFWKKIKREKKIFTSSGGAFHAFYNPNTYSQNFDQGTASAEPDNLSRSFSARFADPSRLSKMQI